EGVDHARPDASTAAVLPAYHAEVRQLRRILRQDPGRAVAGTIVDDDPEGRGDALPGDGIQGPPHEGFLVPAGADDAVTTRVRGRAHERTPLKRFTRRCASRRASWRSCT